MGTYRSKPKVIEAIQWTGGDTAPLDLFLGQNWTRADARDVPWNHDDKEELVIYNALESAWIPCPVGHWIIRGLKGEFYPCEPEVFARSYEPTEPKGVSD